MSGGARGHKLVDAVDACLQGRQHLALLKSVRFVHVLRCLPFQRIEGLLTVPKLVDLHLGVRVEEVRAPAQTPLP